MTIWKVLVFVPLSYLLGGFPFCLLLGKLNNGQDLRRLGNHNVGAWNLIFHVNWAVGVAGALLDAGKGMLAFALGFQAGGPLPGYLCAVAAVAGHNWSPFLRFGGGKGVAACLGCSLSIFGPS